MHSLSMTEARCPVSCSAKASVAANLYATLQSPRPFAASSVSEVPGIDVSIQSWPGCFCMPQRFCTLRSVFVQMLGEGAAESSWSSSCTQVLGLISSHRHLTFTGIEIIHTTHFQSSYLLSSPCSTLNPRPRWQPAPASTAPSRFPSWVKPH